MAQRYTAQKSASRRRIDDSYNRLISQGYYQYGSHARQLQPEPEIYDDYDNYDDYEERIARPKRTRKKVKRSKKVKNVAIEFSFGLKKKTSLMTYAMVFVISSSAIFCLIFMALTSQKKLEVTALKADLKQAQQNNIALQATIYDGYDLAEIEAVATSKLKMMKPEEHQIVRISVPEQSYITQYDNAPEEPKVQFSLSSMYNMVFKD